MGRPPSPAFLLLLAVAAASLLKEASADQGFQARGVTDSGTGPQAAAVAAAKKKWRARQARRPCPPDDARCIALRDHTCEPHTQNVTDKCTFVQYNRHCAEDLHYINYLPLFYCRPPGDTRVLVAMGFLLWMGVLFWVMSKVAEDFLVPALEYLAFWLRLAPDVAGVTLFALASGAPDLFTQIAAVAVGGNVDQELAIGATLGAGLFIIAVILSIVMLSARPAEGGAGGGEGAAGQPEEIQDRRAFVRDAVAYMLSTLALLALMLRGTFAAWEAGLLLLGYGVYLAICLATSRGAGGRHYHGAYAAVSSSQGQLPGQGQHAEQQQQQQQLLAGISPGGPPQLDGVVVASAVAVAGGHEAPLPTATPRAQVELVSRVGGPHPQRKASRAVAAELGGASGDRSPSPARGKLFEVATTQRQQQLWQQLEGANGMQENELVALVGGLPPSDAPLNSDGWPVASAAGAAAAAGGAGMPGASPRAPPWQGGQKLRRTTSGAGGGGRLAGLLHSATLGLEELLHTKGKSGPRLWLSMLMAPAMLLLHATMPALHAGTYTPWYALILALAGPLFTLLSTGLYPHHLTTPYFVLAWLLSALVLCAVMLALPPASNNGMANGALPAVPSVGSTSPLAAPAPSSPFGSTNRLARLSPAPSLGAPGSGTGGSAWARCWEARSVRRPRRHVLLALVASVQCMLWMSLAADELVALFKALGRIMDVSQDLLGATVLAWGEAVPELVATLSLARSGQATMAIAAVFGGPIFNVLIAWAGPTLYAALRRHGPLPYHLSPGVGLLVLFTVAILAFLLVAMPLVFRWRLSRQAAVALLCIYALSQLLFLLAEEL